MIICGLIAISLRENAGTSGTPYFIFGFLAGILVGILAHQDRNLSLFSGRAQLPFSSFFRRPLQMITITEVQY